ncbi:hypothetical protein [Actinokineospora sp.]|uniref:hypothetical protein n=1 Tax=Actinokineospora sp. TaxID=1872133 RepID=UPI00403797E5
MMETRWSSRSYVPTDLSRVLDLFTEADFRFRTELPHLLSAAEVVELLAADTRLLFADGELVGLYGIDPVGNRHGCHYRLHLRLRAHAPQAWWVAAYREIVRALRWRTEVVRLSLQVDETDERGLAAARALDLTDEGTLPGVVAGVGGRTGPACFAQLWPVWS